jgi:large subunit ribosomal protein L11
MAKAVKKIKLQIPAGKATPAPPVGTVLGPAGVNIGDFVNKFNEATRERAGEIVPVEMTVYEDRTFSLVYKVSPMSRLILAAIGVEKGSGKTPLSKVGKLTRAQVRQIAEKKMPDLSAASIEAAEKTVEGTARSMGVTVES